MFVFNEQISLRLRPKCRPP